MSGYDIFLFVLKVIILGSMFGVYKVYGKKWLFILVGAFLSIVFIFYFTTSSKRATTQISKKIEKKTTFNDMYERLVSDKNKATCKEKGLTCKEFYLGHALYKSSPKKSLKYLKSAYENNITSILEDSSARENYITGDIGRLYARLNEYKDAIVYTKKSVQDGDVYNNCILGRYYDKLDMLDEAKAAFEKGINFYECKLELGTFYYNGRGVKQDKLKGAELWKGSYKDDKYGADINFNMAVYHSNETKNIKKYRYHLLKASNLGDEEAKTYLLTNLWKDIDVSDIFVNEAVSKHHYYTPDIEGLKFSYGFDLYYRFKEFYNRDNLWVENYETEDEHSVEFEKDNIKIKFGLKELSVKADIKNSSAWSFTNAIILVISSLHVDVKGLDMYGFTNEIRKRIENKKSFSLSKKVRNKYLFIWQVVYDEESGLAEYLLKIEE